MCNIEVVSEKGRYIGHLQWESIRKAPTVYSNLYGSGVLGMGGTIFLRDDKKFTETACTTRGAWFGKFMVGSKLHMVVIKKWYLGVTSEIMKAMLVVWDIEWKREVKI